jgi:hypothetical protein
MQREETGFSAAVAAAAFISLMAQIDQTEVPFMQGQEVMLEIQAQPVLFPEVVAVAQRVTA